MNNEQKDDRETVMFLARRAGFDIPRERASEVAAILRAWQADAVVLAQRMSASRFDTLLPITIFSHDGSGEGEVS